MPTPSSIRCACAAALIVILVTPVRAQSRPGFAFAEATIADVHGAIRRRATTCRAIVAGYLDRIDRYDKRGPALNATQNSVAIESLEIAHEGIYQVPFVGAAGGIAAAIAGGGVGGIVAAAGSAPGAIANL